VAEVSKIIIDFDIVREIGYDKITFLQPQVNKELSFGHIGQQKYYNNV